MDLATIEMPRAEARKAYLEYRDILKRGRVDPAITLQQIRQNAQDEALAKSYRHLSMGRSLIKLTETLAAGGFDDLYRPRFAIGRADYPQVELRRFRQSGEVTFVACADEEDASWAWSRSRRIVWRGPDDPRVDTDHRYVVDAFALTPSIPPEFRPKAHLKNYHLLWEAEWHTQEQVARAPRDPALLKFLGGDLWAIVGIWDLSELERSVLLD